MHENAGKISHVKTIVQKSNPHQNTFAGQWPKTNAKTGQNTRGKPMNERRNGCRMKGESEERRRRKIKGWRGKGRGKG